MFSRQQRAHGNVAKTASEEAVESRRASTAHDMPEHRDSRFDLVG